MTRSDALFFSLTIFLCGVGAGTYITHTVGALVCG